MNKRFFNTVSAACVTSIVTAPATAQIDPPDFPIGPPPPPPTIGYSVSLDDNSLYKIELETGKATKLGLVSKLKAQDPPHELTPRFNGVIELEFTPDGKLFGIDRNSDSLLQINPTNGRVVKEMPLFGDLNVVPLHAGLAWYHTEPEYIYVQGPNGPQLKLIPGIDSLALAISGTPEVEGGKNLPPAIYLLDHDTGQTDWLTDITFTDSGDPYNLTTIALRQINPLLPFSGAGIESYNINGGGTSGNPNLPGVGPVTEGGTSNLFDSDGNATGDYAWIYVKDDDTTSEGDDNIAIIEDENIVIRTSTITTSGVGNFQSLAIPQQDLFSIIPGDIDLDGTTGFTDFLGFQSFYGQKGTWAQGDFNGDGVVGILDFFELQAFFQGNASQQSLVAEFGEFAATVPEPATSSLLLGTMGLFTLGASRRRNP